MKVCRLSPPARGFTLVEVLVALVIVAFGMGAVLASLSSAADSVIRLREKSFAAWVGFNQLATTRLQATLPASGSTEGDVEFATAQWHWQQTVGAMDIPGLRRITIRVRRTGETTARPASSAGGAANDNWLATVMGFRGDALQTPLDVLQGYDGSRQNPGSGGGPGGGLDPAPGSTPSPPAPGK